MQHYSLQHYFNLILAITPPSLIKLFNFEALINNNDEIFHSSVCFWGISTSQHNDQVL